jgi:hypothetical protein
MRRLAITGAEEVEVGVEAGIGLDATKQIENIVLDEDLVVTTPQGIGIGTGSIPVIGMNSVEGPAPQWTEGEQGQGHGQAVTVAAIVVTRWTDGDLSQDHQLKMTMQTSLI